MKWVRLDARADMDMLGFIPQFLRDDDSRSAREQLNERYAPGGGWHPMKGLKLRADGALEYPGDPPMLPIFMSELHGEMILVYPQSFVLILGQGDTWEVARID